jgi:hypothetical protein
MVILISISGTFWVGLTVILIFFLIGNVKTEDNSVWWDSGWWHGKFNCCTTVVFRCCWSQQGLSWHCHVRQFPWGFSYCSALKKCRNLGYTGFRTHILQNCSRPRKDFVRSISSFCIRGPIPHAIWRPCIRLKKEMCVLTFYSMFSMCCNRYGGIWHNEISDQMWVLFVLASLPGTFILSSLFIAIQV